MDAAGRAGVRMPFVPEPAWWLVGVLLMAVLSAGCGGGWVPRASPGESAAPTVEVQPPTALVPPASGVPTQPPASATNEAPSPTADPPAAVLEASAGRIAGSLGSWTLDGQGSDSPWLPASALREVALHPQRITVRLLGDIPIGPWTARIARADDPTGDAARALGERETADPPVPAIVLESPPPGRWVLSVRLDRADGRGDATFYWLVRVG